MTISDKDFFLALLSMDSYNRGYGLGITLNGNTIGTATLTLGSDEPEAGIPTGVTAGFYAAAYTTDYGTVISYRGTNFSSGAAYADIVNGWAFAAGDFTADQLEVSTQFLETIVNTNGPAITLTGHSQSQRTFGGGLAVLAANENVGCMEARLAS